MPAQPVRIAAARIPAATKPTAARPITPVPLVFSCLRSIPRRIPFARARATAPRFVSGRCPEVNHVAVSDDVFLALEAHLAGFLRALLAAAGHVVGIGDDLGADEAALEVRVDDAGGLRRGIALVDRPGPDFLGARGEVGLQAEDAVAGADQAIEARLLQP